MALLIVYAWMFHTLVIAGNVLLTQHPLHLLRTSPAQGHRQLVGTDRTALLDAEQVMRPGASVAIVFRSIEFTRNYAYYWATLQMYPRPVVIADTTDEAAAGGYAYILDVRDAGQVEASVPDGYQMVDLRGYPDGTVLTVMARA